MNDEALGQFLRYQYERAKEETINTILKRFHPCRECESCEGQKILDKCAKEEMISYSELEKFLEQMRGCVYE